ncbi:MAG TPA: hypothetical protein VMW15_06410 [Terracidiphilus sp.]|nr:hypothetical protein [Terracidiphilus sp.]
MKQSKRIMLLACLLASLLGAHLALAEPQKPLPDIRQLMAEVQAHQKQLEKVRENYTYSSLQTTQDLDSNGKVTKTQSVEGEDFFVNGHVIERMVKKNGQPLSGHDLNKETERVTKLVEKAENTPPGQPLERQTISISRILEIMDVRNARRVQLHGRPTIVFDFIGRKDAKTHGMLEDASKKLQGTIWIDEADRQVAHMEVSFNDNFHVAGGLLANIQKGSSFRFDQAPVNHPNDKDTSSGAAVSDALWLPTGAEASVQARVLLVKNMRQHFVERDYGYKRFNVETQQSKEAQVVTEKAQ